MEKEFRREQHYAVSRDGILAHITDAHSNTNEYYCPHCGCHMLKRCGNIRTWHFAHDWRRANDSQKNCSYETYLHGYAKLRLKQWFEESDSIILHYQQSVICKQYNLCALKRVRGCRILLNKSCDLKQHFNQCSIESSVQESNGTYRADLLLSSDTNNSRHILIEIKVSHGCSEKKKTSNAKIIEFDVESEEDVEYIVTHDIEQSEKVRYFGFDNKVENDNNGIIKPKYSLSKFIHYKSGKTFCTTTNCQSVFCRCPSSIFELTTNDLSKDKYWYLNLYGLMKARDHDIQFPNCFLCEHNNYKNGDNECRIKKKIIEKGSDALMCKSYTFKSNVFERIKMHNIPFRVFYMWRN